MFIAAPFTMAKRWTLPKCPSIMGKEKVVFSYHGAMKRNEVLMHAATWMNLEILR